MPFRDVRPGTRQHDFVEALVSWRAAAKALFEIAIRRDVRRIEPTSLALIDPRHRQDAWFCYDLQLEWLLESHRVNLVLDVGANEGQFARGLRRFYRGDIISFEPVSAPFAQLELAARDDARWTVCQLALGRTDSTATIHVSSDTTFSSLLLQNEFSRERFRRSIVASEETVNVKRLDAILETMVSDLSEKRIFLKLDTQGYDLEVFKSIGRHVEQVILMQSEVSLVPIYEAMPHWNESIATYENAGLCVAGMFPVTRSKTGRIIEYDCLLIRDSE